MSTPEPGPHGPTEQPEPDADLGLVGHELRSPLTAVIGYAQLLGAGSLTDEQHRYAEVIERNGRRMLRLVDELLVSAHLAAGTFGLRRVDLDLADVAGACVTDLGPTARAAGVSLTADLPGPVLVPGDPDALVVAINSLLGGAVRRTPRGGSVTVRVGRAGPVPGTEAGVTAPDAVVEVADTGPAGGQDLPGRAGQDVRGLTLGLPVVAAVVRAHGGAVVVDSGAPEDADSGTRVTVTLPTGSAPAGSREASSTPR
ncbi:sensor histidine kinase [Promicromonospora sukumoe]|uniref:sensor histidine kinase n=1 Tax=Promicromonospora sukumoe TaxID=88382 RepID=UPI0036652947